ncbi:outer membrane beta-barrel protein [Aurantibacter crassamenti]|uniref:outer membrane beta-barrel protein n=1 Tax=Aurantibacter crassamenti TaxID=1837375 RepID=UPI00193A4964|nr:outer membrane beta-barrel protein [Aurantibacter crassamenti]MBM1105307.1 outer membrane beta-barrel protein [Aurantibacter crassamenti]
MSKKNIDNLFQKKLKDFNEIPENRVWNSISDSLDKKKSRKVIPFWWKLSGAAALIAVLFTVFNSLDDKNTVTPVITDTENVNPQNTTKEEATKTIQFEESKEDQIEIVNTDASEIKSETYSDENQESDNTIASQNTKQQDFITTKESEAKASQFATANSEKTSDQNASIDRTSTKNTYANNIDSNDAIAKNNMVDKSEENLKTEAKKNSSNELLNGSSSIEEGVASLPEDDKQEENSIDGQKKSIFDEIEKQTEDEEEALAENSTSKWSVGANLAPVYFNSFGEGSSIDPSFNSNSKSGAVNMSYGLSVAYNVSHKLSVRTGVNKVNYGYNTNEVEFSASLQGSLSSRLNNVNYTQSAENVVVGNKSENISSLANRSSDVIANNISRNGVMAQEFGYIEVPVELDYAIIENRFGVNVIGGVSTLFLTNNSVALNGSDEIIELGEANNLNNMNFSTNVGFGLNYKFTPKVRFNVEPVFKYQLGTFSDTSGNFNPFSIGVYSGLNFKF